MRVPKVLRFDVLRFAILAVFALALGSALALERNERQAIAGGGDASSAAKPESQTGDAKDSKSVKRAKSKSKPSDEPTKPQKAVYPR
jgi:hypothetical protein